MYLEFYGAAEEVTGSLHRIHINGVDVLLDCGMFQGHRAEANRLNREVPSWATKAHCLVLSHAHLDHSGNTPSLVRRGFGGNVYCTPCTRDLCSVLLRDAAMIQQQDARYLNRRNQRDGNPERVEPIYEMQDVEQAISQFVSVAQHRPMPIAPGVTMTLHNAGHVLGSSLVQLDLSERGRNLRLLFTGDLGRAELPLMQPPEVVPDVDFLLMESTYGDRQHPEFANIDDELARIITTTVERGGRIYIPSFALERAQEVLFALERLHEAGRIPNVPIYIDSPLTISITEIYKLHPESLAAGVRKRLLERNDPFAPPGLQYISDSGTSKRLQAGHDPCIIIAGSGMCEGGRIVHHLRTALENPKNTVVIVGFMAQHTLGRRLVERRRQVKVLGVPRDVHAEVRTLDGLSAHADRDDLIGFVRATAAAGNVRRVAVVHGEDAARKGLAEGLGEVGSLEVIQAKRGTRVTL